MSAARRSIINAYSSCLSLGPYHHVYTFGSVICYLCRFLLMRVCLFLCMRVCLLLSIVPLSLTLLRFLRGTIFPLFNSLHFSFVVIGVLQLLLIYAYARCPNLNSSTPKHFQRTARNMSERKPFFLLHF